MTDARDVGFDGFTVTVVESPLIPPGHFLLAPSYSWGVTPLVWQRDPWPHRDTWGTFADVVARERRLAFDHLADQLDDLARFAGLDPDAAWRDPKLAEADRFSRELTFAMEARLALTIARPTDFAILPGA